MDIINIMTKITIMHIFHEKSSVKKKMMLLDKKI